MYLHSKAFKWKDINAHAILFPLIADNDRAFTGVAMHGSFGYVVNSICFD